MKYVPVLSATGQKLMPCHAARARQLVRKGKAIRRFDRGLFYIQLTERENGDIQPIAIGIDQGSKKEAYTVKSESHTYLNIQADAVTWVSESEKESSMLRKTRRQRNCPYRKQRSNRNYGQSFIFPSIRARWGWKLRICNWLMRYYPIETFVVEDVSATIQGMNKRWQKSFSSLQINKTWFYKEIRKLGHLRLVSGNITAHNRAIFGLLKSNNKLSDIFDAHCVDSWTLANLEIGGHVKPDNKSMIYIIPLRFHRRQLHKIQFLKGGKRPKYGGTMSMGLKRGSWVRHPKYGVCYVGGSSKERISLHDMQTGKRLTKDVKAKDCQFLTRSSWRMRKSQ